MDLEAAMGHTVGTAALVVALCILVEWDLALSLASKKNFTLTPGEGGQPSAQFGGGGGGVVVSQVPQLTVEAFFNGHPFLTLLLTI